MKTLTQYKQFITHKSSPYNFFVEVISDSDNNFVSIGAIRKDNYKWSYINNFEIIQDYLLSFKKTLTQEDKNHLYSSTSSDWQFTAVESKKLLKALTHFFKRKLYINWLPTLSKYDDGSWSRDIDVDADWDCTKHRTKIVMSEKSHWFLNFISDNGTKTISAMIKKILRQTIAKNAIDNLNA